MGADPAWTNARIMPGDTLVSTKRFFDAIRNGCVPVLIYHKDSYPVMPKLM